MNTETAAKSSLVATVRAMNAQQLAAAATRSMDALDAAERTGERDQIARALVADERLCAAIDFVTRERQEARRNPEREATLALRREIAGAFSAQEERLIRRDIQREKVNASLAK